MSEMLMVLQECTRYFCQIFMEFKFWQQIFENPSNTEFHGSPYSGSWVVPCGQADGQTWRS